jgi:hypothetical protein
MFGSAMLEVAIGLGLIFALLSLIASGLRESIEALAQTRAIGLERGLRELLADSDGEGTTRALYAHPLIAGLYRGRYEPRALLVRTGAARRLRLGTRLPAYLPARSVALALLDLAAGERTIGVEAVRARIDALPSPALRRALAVAIGEAQGDLDRLIGAVESWFEGAMERVAGWYRKQTHLLLLAIGLALAVCLNVDALALARALYREPALRATIVAEAEAGTACASGQASACAETRLAALDLPIGWRGERRAGWWRALPGWMITGVAVSLGAPFWFDLLGRVTSIRSTLRPRP